MGIDSAEVQKFFVCTAFRNLVVGYYKDLISISDGRQSVCNCNRSTVFGEFLQALLNPAFTFVVKGAGGLIKNQDRRIL